MSREFYKTTNIRTNHLLPDNYLGIGRSANIQLCMELLEQYIGFYERVLVLGLMDTLSKKDTCLVEFLDLQTKAGEKVYGVIPITELSYEGIDKNLEQFCPVGTITTVAITGTDAPIVTDATKVVPTFNCSRKIVQQRVLESFNNDRVGSTLLGRVKGRIQTWGFAIDIGCGVTLNITEKEYSKFGTRVRNLFEGSLILLEKTETNVKPKNEATNSSVNITNKSRVVATITRTDKSGCLFGYIENCGFIIIKGIYDKTLNANKKFTHENQTYAIGDTVLVEVVNHGTAQVGYIIKNLNTLVQNTIG